MSDPSTIEALNALKVTYLKSLPSHVKSISETWRRLRHLNWESVALQNLYATAHKLAGSGTTFGFPQITSSARALELLLKPLVEEQLPSDAQLRNELEAAVNALLEQINSAVNGEPPVKVTERRPTPATTHSSRGDTRLAIIEDDNLLGQQYSAWLGEMGYKVTLFASPEAFEAELKEHHFDLLLLDIAFPSDPYGGLLWLERAKPLLGSHLPVVMTSARTDMLARLRALRAGASAYLIKPIEKEVLATQLELLDTHLEESRDKVLIVDDDEMVANHYRIALEAAGFSVRLLHQPLAILDTLERYHPEVIVLDYQMPGINGVEVATVLRQEPRYVGIPIIFVSGDPQALKERNAFSVVGNAFLSKPVSAEQLIDTIRLHLVQARAIHARMRISTLRQQSGSLLNKAYFLSSLQESISAPANDGRRFLLAELAVNNLAYLKQRHGLLEATALCARIESFLADYTYIEGNGCVLGDGAYLLRMALPSQPQGEKILNDLLQLLDSNNFQGQTGAIPQYTVGAVWLDGSVSNAEQALKLVEECCAQALAERGPGSVVIASAPQTVPQQADTRMREAIEAANFRLNFQPIINIGSEAPIYEVLVRLVDDNGEEYLPRQFFPYVEKNIKEGLTFIDRWVIEHTITYLKELGGKEAETNKVVIKLSPTKENLPKLLFYIANVMQNSRLRYERRVYFSLKSDFVLHNLQAVTNFMRGLHDLNCGVMMENYPEESATNAIFKDLPLPDMLKLDSAWNKKIAVRGGPAGEALKQLQGELGDEVRIIATAVEDSSLFVAYWELGVRDFQGYFVQRPGGTMSHESLEARLGAFM